MTHGDMTTGQPQAFSSGVQFLPDHSSWQRTGRPMRARLQAVSAYQGSSRYMAWCGAARETRSHAAPAVSASSAAIAPSSLTLSDLLRKRAATVVLTHHAPAAQVAATSAATNSSMSAGGTRILAARRWRRCYRRRAFASALNQALGYSNERRRAT